MQFKPFPDGGCLSGIYGKGFYIGRGRGWWCTQYVFQYPNSTDDR
jgi:hypothetical protein